MTTLSQQMHFPAPGRDNTPFLLEITNIPSSFSLGQPPHQFHQPTCFCATYPDFYPAPAKKMCLLLFTTYLYLGLKSFSS